MNCHFVTCNLYNIVHGLSYLKKGGLVQNRERLAVLREAPEAGSSRPGGPCSASHAHRPWGGGAQRGRTQSLFQTSAAEQPVWVEVPQKTPGQRQEFKCRRAMIPRGAPRA